MTCTCTRPGPCTTYFCWIVECDCVYYNPDNNYKPVGCACHEGYSAKAHTIPADALDPEEITLHPGKLIMKKERS